MGRPEVRHYKAIPFADIHFDGGSLGVEIGHTGFMGSENLFLDCHWLSCSTAGLLTSNANALQQTILGGNFQGCGTGIYIGTGSVPVVHGVGFQVQSQSDIYTGSSQRNAMEVAGCRSESTNFINNAGGQKLRASACSHISGSNTNGYFLAQAGGHAILSGCVSTFGALVPTSWAHIRVEECEWNRSDWLQLDPTHLWWAPNNTRTFCLEIENTDYQDASGNWVEIRRQRLVTLDGQTITTYNYAAS